MPRGCGKGAGLQEIAVLVQCWGGWGVGVELQELCGEIKGSAKAWMSVGTQTGPTVRAGEGAGDTV